jgi:uncharacterized LabA/DUF88 family protein
LVQQRVRQHEGQCLHDLAVIIEKIEVEDTGRIWRAANTAKPRLDSLHHSEHVVRLELGGQRRDRIDEPGLVRARNRFAPIRSRAGHYVNALLLQRSERSGQRVAWPAKPRACDIRPDADQNHRDSSISRRRLTRNAPRKTLTLHYQRRWGISQMIFYPEERLAIFIDGANLYSAARGLAFDIDYRRLLDLFSTKGRLIRAFYYTALVEDQEYSPIRPLVDWLDYNGYAMVTKPTKEFTDAMGRRRIKGNMDIELAIDMLEMAQHIDHAILFSGDGDFRRLVEAVQRKGVRVSVVSTIRSSPPMVSDELRRQADNFIELQDLAPSVMRNHHVREESHRPRTEPVDEE